MLRLFVLSLIASTAQFSAEARCSSPGGLLQSVEYPTKCLHIKNPASTQLGLRLDLADCDNYALDQLWNVEDMVNYASTPGPVAATLNNQVISIGGDRTANGGEVALYPDNSQTNQQFAIVAGDYNSQFLLQAVNSKKCLTVQGGGVIIDQWDCIHAANQQFKVVRYGTYAG